jgi:hypothetical protein
LLAKRLPKVVIKLALATDQFRKTSILSQHLPDNEKWLARLKVVPIKGQFLEVNVRLQILQQPEKTCLRDFIVR